MRNAIFGAAVLSCSAGGGQVATVSPPTRIPVSEPLDMKKYELKQVEDTLENGMRVIVVQKDKLPIFQVSVLVRTGSAFDPEGKGGLASLTASCLEEGTKTRSAEEIYDAVEGWGGSISAGAGPSASSVSLKVLSSDAKRGLEILADVLMNPAFERKAFENLKSRVVSGIIASKSDADKALDVVFNRLLWEGTPLAHPVEGSETSVASLKPDDVKDFYARYYAPNNAVAVVVTNLAPSEALDEVREAFGAWKPVELKFPAVAAPAKRSGVTARVFHIPGLNQVYVSLGFVGLSRSDPDYNQTRVMNYILGGSGFSSRILKKIRVEKGYAYSAHSYFDNGYPLSGGDVLPGAFRATMEVRVEEGNDAVRELTGLISDMKRSGATAGELAAAKSYYEGSIARSGESYGQVADLVGKGVLFGLRRNYWIRDISDIMDLSLEKVNAAAVKRLSPEDFVLVVVTDTSKFKLEGYSATVEDYK